MFHVRKKQENDVVKATRFFDVPTTVHRRQQSAAAATVLTIQNGISKTRALLPIFPSTTLLI